VRIRQLPMTVPSTITRTATAQSTTKATADTLIFRLIFIGRTFERSLFGLRFDLREGVFKIGSLDWFAVFFFFTQFYFLHKMFLPILPQGISTKSWVTK